MPLLRMLFLLIPLLLVACSDGSDRSVTVTAAEPEPPADPPAEPPPEPLPDLGVEVEVEAGLVAGQASSRAVTWEWLGIPFAAPPVGELRWQAPQPAPPLEGTLAATEFAPECPHYDFFGIYVGDENCLFLNVWRPQTQERDLPVFLWIHGGGNNTGSANWPVYNGARLAELANVVVVSVQYRLGPLGWLYLPALQNGDPATDSGNFGTLDIIAALQWVQDNIARFGGDPDNVAAAGESAGGANVLSLMLSPRATGLFHKAIVQSAGGSVTDTGVAEQRGRELADALWSRQNLPDMEPPPEELAAYLRSLTPQDIIDNNPGVGAIYGDGAVIPAAGYDLFDSGDFPGKVPLLIGTNRDEFKLYTNPLGYNVLPDASEELRAVVGRYRSDLWRVEGADDIATRLRMLDDFPDIYVYRFNWGSPDENGNSPLPGDFGETGGAHHGAEMPFMFGNWDTFLIDAFKEILYPPENEASRMTMADVMVAYWGAFIRDGVPSASGLPAWMAWDNTEGAYKAITLDVNFDDNSPRVGEDREVWTREFVIQQAMDNVPEPLLSELLPYLE